MSKSTHLRSSLLYFSLCFVTVLTEEMLYKSAFYVYGTLLGFGAVTI